MVAPQTPGVPDHALVTKTVGISPKAIWPTVAMAVVSVVVTILNGVQENPSLLGALPTWLQSVILLVIPPVATYLSAYAASPGTVSTAPARES